MNEDRRIGQRAGIRWAIAWLTKRAIAANTSADYMLIDKAARDMAKAARALRNEDADDIAAGLEALREPVVGTWPEVKTRLNLGGED